MPTKTTNRRPSETLPLTAAASEPAKVAAPAAATPDPIDAALAQAAPNHAETAAKPADDAPPPPVLTGAIVPAPTNQTPPPPPERHPPAVAIVNGCARPDTLEGIFRIGQLFHRSKMTPVGTDTQEQVIVALMAGLEVGLTPTQAIQNVMVINGRPSVWGDAALALVQASGVIEDIEETMEGEENERVAICRVKRKDRPTPTVRSFSVQDAIDAGLWGNRGPWKSYPKRMLQMRARSWALRDSCPDVLKGIAVADEVGDYTRAPKPSMSAGNAPDDLADLPQNETLDPAKVRRA